MSEQASQPHQEREMTAVLSGPMFEPARRSGMQSIFGRQGGHYNIFQLGASEARESDAELAMESLRGLFPDGEANELNVCLFSTSGVHGCYTTIEEVEAGFAKYGDEPDFGDGDWPDGYAGDSLTVLVLHPRTVCLRYGNVKVRSADLEWLKRLRASSHAALAQIGSAVPALYPAQQMGEGE